MYIYFKVYQTSVKGEYYCLSYASYPKYFKKEKEKCT